MSGDREAVAPERLAREDRQDLEHDAEAGQREDVDLRVPEEPEDVLVQERACRRREGRKNDVLAVRSSAIMKSPLISTGAPSTISVEVAKTLHTKIGRRLPASCRARAC